MHKNALARAALLAAFMLAGSAVVSAQSPLLTTFAGGNGQSGNMFDVKSLTGVLIQDFDCNFAGSGDFEVWALNTPGTYLGNQTSNANWTMLASVTGIPGTTGVPNPLGLNLNFAIPPGITQAFYIHRTNGTVTYTNGTTQGNLFTSNQNLEFYEGHGGTYFNLNFVPRVWNGQIHYLPLSTSTDDLTLFNIDSPVNDAIDCEAGSAAESVSVTVLNLGMNPVAIGSILTMSLQVDGNAPIFEFLTLTQPLMLGEQLQYTFTATADLSAIGNHTITTAVFYALDLDPSNDSQTLNIGSGGQLRVTNFPYVEDFTVPGMNGSTEMPLGWIQDPGDATGNDSDWIIRNDGTPTLNTGPQFDHTTGTVLQGGYIHVDDDGSFPTVNLRSPCFDLGGLINPSARFFMHSNSVSGSSQENTLSIDVITTPGTVVTMDVFGPEGHIADNWEMRAVDLTPFAGQLVQLVLRADTSTSLSNGHDIAIDDFSIVELLPTPGQAPQPGLAQLDINTSSNVNGDILAFGFGGPYFSNVQQNSSIAFKMTGEPMQPIIMFAGPLNPAIASFPSIGSIDCGGAVDPMTGFPTGLVVLADGTQPVLGGFNPFFVTDANGSCDVGFSVPSLPLGPLTTFQCAHVITGGAGLALSNAVQVQIVP